MQKAHKILIAGFGDIGKRVASRLCTSRRYKVTALVRQSNAVSRDPNFTRSLGVKCMRGDLSRFHTLQNLPTFDTVLHFAPPPATGRSDSHTKNLLAALTGMRSYVRRGPRRFSVGRLRMLPRQIVYISTTGVYGNCDGAWIDETRTVKPESARAKRRVNAERQLQKWGQKYGVSVTILRAPGIYAGDRLPLDRIRRQTPVLRVADDVFTNHIHADDLASAVKQAIRQQRPKQFRIFNVVDDGQLLMGDYFDQLADGFGLARPPRISFAEAERSIPSTLLSFMRESRRISNARIKRELKLVLTYPTVATLLSVAPPKIVSLPD